MNKWILEDPLSKAFIYCRACRKFLKARKHDLYTHSLGGGHKAGFNKMDPNDPLPTQEELKKLSYEDKMKKQRTISPPNSLVDSSLSSELQLNLPALGNGEEDLQNPLVGPDQLKQIKETLQQAHAAGLHSSALRQSTPQRHNNSIVSASGGSSRSLNRTTRSFACMNKLIKKKCCI